ncbi:MAG: VOC family protein [Novosphingobium sp.]|nr:VOC family protein [Novosphingobium sp.]
MSSRDGGFIWYELMTPDADRAARFYCAVVGWKVAAHSDPASGMDYRMIQRADGGNAGGVLGLTKEMCEGGARPCWLGYIHAADVDATVAAIITDGGTVQMPATDLPVGRIAMVTDPQGAPFYVMAPVPPPGVEVVKSDVFSVDQPQHVRWNELSTSDPDAAIAFYARHFGWAQDGAMDMGPLGQYRFIQHGGMTIGAVMPMMEPMPAPIWVHYIGVDDIDRAAEAVTAHGGRIVEGPNEIPGGEFALTGTDCCGALFGLVGPRKG